MAHSVWVCSSGPLDTWPAGRCCPSGWQPPAWPWTWSLAVGRSGAPLVDLVLSTVPPSFSGLPFLPYWRHCLPAPVCVLPGINALARPLLLPIIWRHVCQRQGCGLGVEQSEVAQPEEAGSRTVTCPFSAPQSGTFRTASLNTAPLWPQGLPQTFPGLWVSHPGQRNRTVGVPTLSALGRALTCNRSGKQP